jgi:hypothetical protein
LFRDPSVSFAFGLPTIHGPICPVHTNVQQTGLFSAASLIHQTTHMELKWMEYTLAALRIVFGGLILLLAGLICCI